MKIKTLALSVCLLLPFQLTTADIASDFKAGLSATKVLENALANKMDIVDAVSEMLDQQPKRRVLITSAAVTVSPENTSRIVSAAIALLCDNAKTKDIQTRCVNTIQTAALAAGADPTAILAATAAGRTSLSINKVGSVFGRTGGGCGDTASCS